MWHVYYVRGGRITSTDSAETHDYMRTHFVLSPAVKRNGENGTFWWHILGECRSVSPTSM